MKIKALAKSIGKTIWDQRSNIEFVAGNLMVVGGTAMIMTKAEDAVEVKHEYEFAKKSIELKDENNDWEGDKERKKECFDAAKNAAVGYAKCYGPGLAVEAGGLVLMAISKATDRKELAVTSAALASTAMEFANYRQKVRDEFGAEKDEQLYLGSVKKIVNEDGSTSIDADSMPSHAIPFTRDNVHWSDYLGVNFDFAENVQRWMNMKLQKEGVIYENDIRRALGAKIDPRAEGWGITAVDDDGNTNFIDLGIYRDTGRAVSFRDGQPVEMIFVLNNMEPRVNTKLYRLMKYHRDWDCELQG